MRARIAQRIFTQIGTAFRQRLKRLVRECGGNVATIVALTAVPLAGAMGMAVEGSSWYLVNRVAQNAADSAVLAAAANNGTSYDVEAQSVTANFGFTNGANNTTVTVVNTDDTVPSQCSAHCYKVTITRTVPTYLLQAIGYPSTQQIQASAVAVPYDQVNLCLIALGTSTNAIHTNGTPKSDLTGCDIGTNGSANCNGGGLNADHVVAVGTADGTCGAVPESGAATLVDPYSAKAANIPNNTQCTPTTTATTYPQEAGGMQYKLSGTVNWTGFDQTTTPKVLCGDVQLTADTTINTAPGGTLLVIQNGVLDTNGFKLTASGLTIVFGCGATSRSSCPTITVPSGGGGGKGKGGGGGGSTPFTPSHYPTGGGTLDISGPTSGNWSGVALYQDPLMTSNVSFSYTGNSPAWDITGLVYLPHADIDFKGVVNKSSNGVSCFTIVTNTILISGTGSIYANPQSQCNTAGLTQFSGGSVRQYLVF